MVFNELFDPIDVTRRMKDEEFLKYVKICKKGKKTSAKKLEQIKADFYYLHQPFGKEALDEIWESVEDMLENNAGLAEFTLDYAGASSEFFFPWLITIKESPSAALEMAYGYGYDLSNTWKQVPEEDAIYAFVQNDPTFVFNRERQLYVANLVTRQREMSTKMDGRYFYVADLGAGQMAWARHHGFLFPWWQKIYAYDRDPTINPDELFSKREMRNNIFYFSGDIMTSLSDLPFNLPWSVIILQGVASYYPMGVFKEAIIQPVYEKLEVGGVFFFDLQLDCPYYRRSVAIFDWPKMQLIGSSTEAIGMVEDLRLSLRKEGKNFSVSYKMDSFNEHPSSIMIKFAKLSS